MVPEEKLAIGNNRVGPDSSVLGWHFRPFRDLKPSGFLPAVG